MQWYSGLRNGRGGQMRRRCCRNIRVMFLGLRRVLLDSIWIARPVVLSTDLLATRSFGTRMRPGGLPVGRRGSCSCSCMSVIRVLCRVRGIPTDASRLGASQTGRLTVIALDASLSAGKAVWCVSELDVRLGATVKMAEQLTKQERVHLPSCLCSQST